MKTCARCKQQLPDEKFYPSKGRLSSYCKVCNRKRISEWQKKNRERATERQTKWRTEHPDSTKEYQKEYVSRHPERRKESVHRYNTSEKGKETKLLHVHKRLSMLRDVEFSLTTEEWRQIQNKYNGMCAGCGREFDGNVKATIDHIIPLSKGGATTKENIQPLCSSCNNSKGNNIRWTYPVVAGWT